MEIIAFLSIRCRIMRMKMANSALELFHFRDNLDDLGFPNAISTIESTSGFLTFMPIKYLEVYVHECIAEI